MAHIRQPRPDSGLVFQVKPLKSCLLPSAADPCSAPAGTGREFCIDNLLVRSHFIILMIRWTGLAPWEFDSLFQVALLSYRQVQRSCRARGKPGDEGPGQCASRVQNAPPETHARNHQTALVRPASTIQHLRPTLF